MKAIQAARFLSVIVYMLTLIVEIRQLYRLPMLLLLLFIGVVNMTVATRLHYYDVIRLSIFSKLHCFFFKFLVPYFYCCLSLAVFAYIWRKQIPAMLITHAVFYNILCNVCSLSPEILFDNYVLCYCNDRVKKNKIKHLPEECQEECQVSRHRLSVDYSFHLS